MNENIQKTILIILLIGSIFLYDYWDKTACKNVSSHFEKCRNYLE